MTALTPDGTDTPMPSDPSDGDQTGLVEWVPVEAEPDLLSVTGSGRPGRAATGDDLDLHIGWDRFEKLMLAVAKGPLGFYGVRFRRYGTPGQEQHGIDLAGREADGRHVVVQCKDYQVFTVANLRSAVTKFVQGRRPFDAYRLVVATSAATQSTQLTEELAVLQDAHKDLVIDLWGAEEINDILRYRADIVARFWTRETAEAFCTGAPLPGVPMAPLDRQEQADRILLGPLSTSDMAPLLRLAEAKMSDSPAEAAAHFGDLAARLEASGFRGHAAALRTKQLDALHSAGLVEAAAELAAQLAVTDLHRGNRHEARKLAQLLEQFTAGDGAAGGDSASLKLHAELVGAAVSHVCHPLGMHRRLLNALTAHAGAGAAYHPSVVLLLAEDTMALTSEGLHDMDGLITKAITEAEARNDNSVPDLVLRLRLTKGEYSVTERRELRKLARLKLVPARQRALISSREARRCSLEGRTEEALEAWRDAVNDAIIAGLVEDAADWLYAISQLNVMYGPLSTDIDDEFRLAQSLRATGKGRLLERSREPREQAMSAVVQKKPVEAVLSARRWLTDSFVTGSWTAESEALEFLADLYADNKEESLASSLYQRAGRSEKLTALADKAGEQLLPIGPLSDQPWWVTTGRAALVAAQADLLDDATATEYVEELTYLTARARSGELVDSPLHHLKTRLVRTLCDLAPRGTAAQASAVLDLLAPDVPRQPGHYLASDDHHAAMCVTMAVSQPELAMPALTRLFDLAEFGTNKALQLVVDSTVLQFLEPNEECSRSAPAADGLSDKERQTLRERAVHLVEAKQYLADVLLFAIDPGHQLVGRLSEQARDRILQRPDPHPGYAAIGTSLVSDSYLVRGLPQEDQEACLQRLLKIASDPLEVASNRREALVGARNVVIDLTHNAKSRTFAVAQTFVGGNPDPSNLNQFNHPPHPLSSFRVNMGSPSLRGKGLALAVAAAASTQENDGSATRLSAS